METCPLYIGIDVSKAQLDVAYRLSGKRQAVPHMEAGITTLVVPTGFESVFEP